MAVATLVAIALAVDIISFLLWSAWIVFASVALARGERAQGVAVARSP